MSSKRKSFDFDSMEVVKSKKAKNVMVSFSKRRQGLFRKASELCSKFDAQIAILVLSPSQNPFSFGHSSVDDVIRRYDSLIGRTTAVVGEEENAVNESRRMRQENELEALRARVREKKRAKRESSLNPNTDHLINVENWESVEELEGFKVKCLALLQLIREKLRDDLSFLDPGSGSGSFNVAGNNSNFNLLRSQQNDMSFPIVMPGSSVMTTVDHQANENDVSFSLPNYGDYGGGWGFGAVGAGSPEVMVDQQNYLLPTDGSSGGSNYNDDSFLFTDQISSLTGVGDENLGFCQYENNLLHGQQNDMSFLNALSDNNNFGTISACGFGSVGGDCSFWR